MTCLFIIYIIFWITCLDGNISAYTDNILLRFSVCVTTIPPRFKSIQHSLLSWFEDGIGPSQIFIFIPKNYRRFRRRLVVENISESLATLENHAVNLRHKLLNNEALSRLIQEQRIQIIELEKDWGPISKFIGVMSVANMLDDYIVFCDDDVRYSSKILDLYGQAWQAVKNRHNVGHLGFTIFAETYRLLLPTFGKGSTTTTYVQHVQGVDTYAIPKAALRECNGDARSLCFVAAVQIVEAFHKICPQSFYQDDYIASYLIHTGDVVMKSIRNVDHTVEKFVQNIDNVSKAYFQMHMQGDVFIREYGTQQCVMGNAEAIYFSYILSSDIILQNIG